MPRVQAISGLSLQIQPTSLLMFTITWSRMMYLLPRFQRLIILLLTRYLIRTLLYLVAHLLSMQAESIFSRESMLLLAEQRILQETQELTVAILILGATNSR